jgi:hypothetical protein
VVLAGRSSTGIRTGTPYDFPVLRNADVTKALQRALPARTDDCEDDAEHEPRLFLVEIPSVRGNSRRSTIEPVVGSVPPVG